jgi:cell division protein FtsL
MTILTKLLTPDSRPDPAQKAGSHAYKAVAEAVGTLRQYQDVPLRLQRQWITAFLVVMVLVSTIAGLYLNIASRTAIAGREIQHLQRLITVNQRANADLQTQIAMLLSSDSLEERALAAGYVPLQGADLKYMVVPGYFPQKGISLVSPAAQTEDIRLSPEYSESLFSWLSRQIETASLPLAQEH